MTDELFTIDPTPVCPLVKARARLAKAEAEILRTYALYDEHGDAAWYLVENAKNELSSAKNSVQVEEQRALERLRAARKP
jgi:Mg2+ and Co2+ transporter CorA